MPMRQSWTPPESLIEEFERRRGGCVYREEEVPRFVLPDALAMENGEQVRCEESWQARRAEMLALFETEMFGRAPPAPDKVHFEVSQTVALDARAVRKEITGIIAHQDRKFEFSFRLLVPIESKNVPAPVMLFINNRGREVIDPPAASTANEFWPSALIVQRGYAAAAFDHSEFDPDEHDGFRNGIHGFFDPEARERDACAWGAVAAWAWGASRCLDYLERDTHVDAKRVAVIGHSRGGKAALWAAASDSRFAMAVSNNSGCGGAALSRRRFDETIGRLTERFPHWFCARFSTYGNGREHQLPTDAHMLIALLAPRSVYIASASADLWADPRGEFLSLAEASKVWEAVYAGTSISSDDMPESGGAIAVRSLGYHLRNGKHGLFRFDWNHFLEFADREIP